MGNERGIITEVFGEVVSGTRDSKEERAEDFTWLKVVELKSMETGGQRSK